MGDEVTTDLRFSIVPHWIIKHDISDRALRLYAVLAKFADAETGQAFPGRTRLSKELRCSLKSVDRAVAELMAIGAIRKTQRVTDGHYQSSLYTVVRIDPGSSETRPRVVGDATPRHGGPDPVSPVTHITRTTELEPIEPKPLNNIGSKFKEFWNLYPKKQGRGAAQKALEKALVREKWEIILDGVQRFANDPNLPEKQFIPLASTWLNQDRWTDEPYAAPTVKLANWQKAALLAEKYRQEAGVKEIEYQNKTVARELETEVSTWLKGVDDE